MPPRVRSAAALRSRLHAPHQRFVPLAALSALVGLSRSILDAHWLSDVIAAYLLSLALLALDGEGYVRYLLRR